MFKLPFTTFIAWRYLRSKRKIALVSIISLISLIGVTIGVSALIIVLSVFNGFNGLVTKILVEFDPHIRIEKKLNLSSDDFKKIENAISDISQIKGYAPFIISKAMLISDRNNRVVYVKGIDPEKAGLVSGLPQKIVLGNFDLNSDNGLPKIILGLTIADRVNALVGDTVTLVSPSFGGIFGLVQPNVKKFIVSGIFESNNKDYDGYYAFVSVKSAQELFDMRGKINGVEIRLNDINQSEKVKKIIQTRLGENFQVKTWYDLHKDLYSVMQIERWTAYVILSLIIFVATFNILGSLTMSVIEKTRDIGILKAMGAKNSDIVRIFMFEGVIIGIVGASIGSAIGYLACYIQEKYHIFPLDPTVYIIPSLPVEMHLTDFIVVGISAIILCSLASYYPARRAASIIPSEAIRWE
ncbi:ABC transporter permease [Candidatus Chrysopegis kryptomonas]|jgi:lipoprotein-releasing system permease protein|uniref:Lipoprotein-releasing system permease protein n=1 Tax=Candidatus Chryseopegocella kryptomonas TaxID=1633643 RepID=A0A0P1MMC4_9BACT|nr:ABC transporter permease [Candidatus Chrysopegis kryptomonas]CUS96644.1 lipoprotein-releasing system permease protein [Candidatus Chrysopegis kryptomonas]